MTKSEIDNNDFGEFSIFLSNIQLCEKEIINTMINIMIFFHQFHIIFKKLSMLDGSIVSMRSSKNLDFEKMLQNNL